MPAPAEAKRKDSTRNQPHRRSTVRQRSELFIPQAQELLRGMQLRIQKRSSDRLLDIAVAKIGSTLHGFRFSQGSAGNRRQTGQQICVDVYVVIHRARLTSFPNGSVSVRRYNFIVP